MNRAAAWSVRGVGRETREIAEEAARRAGMRLGDWLDEVVAEQAAEQGVSADDWDEEEKLDAIGDRLSRLSRHERVSESVRREGAEDGLASRLEPKRAGEEARARDSLRTLADDRVEIDGQGAIGERLSRLSRRERAPAAVLRATGEYGQASRPERKRFGEEARRTRDSRETAADDRDDFEERDAIGDRLSRPSRHERAPVAVPRDTGEYGRASRSERKRFGEEARGTRDSRETAADDRDDFEERDAIGDRLSRPSRHERVPVAVPRDSAEERRAPNPERQRSGEEAPRAQDPLQTAAVEGDDADKLDAIADRLSQLSSRERARGATRPNVGEERPKPKPSAEEARRAQELLEAAVTKFEARAAKSDERTAKAFESVASWIEQSQEDRAHERATLQSVAQKLTAIEQRSVRDVERPPLGHPRVAPQGEDAEADIDKRLSALARRVGAPQRPRTEHRRRDDRPRIDVRDSVAQIARRQTELDSREASARRFATTRTVPRGFGLDQAPAKMRAPEPEVRPPTKPSPAEALASSEETLRKEIEALNARIERLRADGVEQTTSPTLAEDLRAGLAAMSRSLAALAPRNASVALEGAVGDFGQRLDAARKAGASDHLVAALESMLDQVRKTLRDHDPGIAAQGLEREIRALGDRVDALARATVSPEVFGRLREQTEEVRNLLAEAALRPVPVERLERQIGDLADRVERLATSTTPHADTARVVEALSEARSQIERSTPAAALNSIERRLEQLTARMDEALRRTPAIDPRPIEDLARRIEGVRATVERQTDFRPHAAKLEAALTDINSKLDRAPVAGGADSKALASTLQELTARLEEIFRRSSSSSNFDPRPIEDLARRIEAVRTTMERQGDFRPHAAKLEAALGDINSKLDRSPAGGGDTKALLVTLQDQMARLEEAFKRPASSVNIDPRPIEELARRIENVRVTVERQADFRPHAAKLEAALSDINSKLDRAPGASNSNALTSTLQDLAARLDEAFRRPAATPKFDPEPIEDLARRIDRLRATIESTTDFLPGAGKLDTALADISAKLDRQAFSPEDVQALTGALQDLASRIDQAGNSIVDTAPIERILRGFGQRTVEVDTTPIEAMLRDLGEKFAASTAPVAIDTSPIELMLSRVDAKLDAVARLPMDVRPLENAVRELHEKLDFRDAPGIDARVIEQAAELLAKRLEQRDGSGVDAEALVNQISEIHGRLDSLHATADSNVALERTVAELLDELEATRKTLQSNASASNGVSPMVGDIAELRTEQTNSDRRMQARLADVQDILERLVSRLGRIEDEVARADEGEPQPQRSTPTFGGRHTMRDSRTSAEASDAALRSIPDRIPRPSPPEGFGGAPRTALANSPEGADFLLEPGRQPQRTSEEESDPPLVRNSGINAHIAAARRAAQAALLDSASKNEEVSASRSQGPRAGSWGMPLKQAQDFFAARRRPILLGVAFLAIVTTLAVVGLHVVGGHPQGVQKSELPAPLQSPAPLASIPRDSGAPKTAASVDYSPVGSLAPVRTPLSSALRPAPADMVAVIPAGIAATLRDSASAGDTGAETEIALRYLEGRTLPRDPKLAARWFEQAAVQGLPIAQYRLAALYEKGTGVTRDVSLARSWYLKAANAGNARAMHNLAVLDAEDAGNGKPDYADAAQWFRRAGELGVRDSQFNLGVLYGRGLGVPQDLQQSWLWFSLASRQGDSDAAKKRDEVAAKLDSKGSAAAAKALAEFKERAPEPSANEVPAPAGGWDARADAPQSGRQTTPSAGGTVSLNSPHG